jgi:sulfate transport system ATP-binding protein
LDVPAPDHREHPSAPAFGYVRPHDLEIAREAGAGESTIPARITQISVAGPRARIKMVGAEGDAIEAEIPKLRYQELGLRAGEEVFVRPLAIRLFVGSPPA